MENAGNIFGHSIACYSPNLTLPQLVNRSLFSVDRDDYEWDSYKPDVIVSYLGSNDWNNIFPPSTERFAAGYAKFIESLVAPYAPRPPPVVHVCDNYPGCPVIKQYASNRSLNVYFSPDQSVGRSGCDRHRNATQQKSLAEALAPVIKKAVYHRDGYSV